MLYYNRFDAFERIDINKRSASKECEICHYWYCLDKELNLKISFWEYSFIMNKHNQKPTDMFHKQVIIVYLTYIKILKDLNILNFRLHIPDATFKVL